ncbi:hypothetical protein D3C71_2113170 [compost metagenome]
MKRKEPDGLLLRRRAAGAAVRGLIHMVAKLEDNREGIGAAERSALEAVQKKLAALLAE